MPSSVYWDACLFIEALQKKVPERVDSCLDMIRQAKKGDIVIVASAYMLAEVQKLKHLETTAGMSRAQQSKMIREFFENPFIWMRPLDRQTAELAHDLLAAFPIASGDAIHVATALVSKVEVLYTWDEHKDRRRKGLLAYNRKFGTPALRIETPPDPGAGTLFAGGAGG